MIRLLFSSAGRRVELVNCFRQAARGLNINLEVIAIDMDPLWSPACQVADYAYKVPHCTSSDFLNDVLDICKRHEVDMIIPTIDTELIGYAENREHFSENGTEILVSSVDFVRVTRDKEETAHILSNNGISAPRTWNMQDTHNLEFPLLIKPRDGSCSNGIYIVNSKNELLRKDIDNDLYIAQEICQGREFTVNCFYDRLKGCVGCVPHFRKFMRAGEVCFAETVRIPKFKVFADKLYEIFSEIYGCICFQGFQDDSGNVSIFEINARFGGGYPICDKAGGTFARWILQDLRGEVPDYHNNWQEGIRMLRYDAAVFIEIVRKMHASHK